MKREKPFGLKHEQGDEFDVHSGKPGKNDKETKDRIIELKWADKEDVEFKDLQPGMLVWVGGQYEIRSSPIPNMSRDPFRDRHYRDYSSFNLGILKHCKFTQEIGDPEQEKKRTREEILESLKNIDLSELKLDKRNEYKVILEPALFFERQDELSNKEYKVSYLEHLVEAKGEIYLPGNDFIRAVYEKAPDLLLKLRIDTYQHLFVNDKLIPLGDLKYLGGRRPALIDEQEEKE